MTTGCEQSLGTVNCSICSLRTAAPVGEQELLLYRHARLSDLSNDERDGRTVEIFGEEIFVPTDAPSIAEVLSGETERQWGADSDDDEGDA